MRNLLSKKYVAALAIVLLIGCQSNSPPSRVEKPLPTDRNATLDEAVATDACAIRLGDITAAMTMYYGLNKQLPPSLQELKTLAMPGSELQFTCPVSGIPYVYSSAGLLAVGTNKKIIVWDATPSHDGSRWCILKPPTETGGAVAFELVALPESAFRMYVPAIQ